HVSIKPRVEPNVNPALALPICCLSFPSRHIFFLELSHCCKQKTVFLEANLFARYNVCVRVLSLNYKPFRGNAFLRVSLRFILSQHVLQTRLPVRYRMLFQARRSLPELCMSFITSCKLC